MLQFTQGFASRIAGRAGNYICLGKDVYAVAYCRLFVLQASYTLNKLGLGFKDSAGLGLGANGLRSEGLIGQVLDMSY